VGLLVLEEGLWTLGASRGTSAPVPQRLIPPECRPGVGGGPPDLLSGGSPPARIVVYQHPALLPLEEGTCRRGAHPACAGGSGGSVRLPQFWNPEGRSLREGSMPYPELNLARHPSRLPPLRGFRGILAPPSASPSSRRGGCGASSPSTSHAGAHPGTGAGDQGGESGDRDLKKTLATVNFKD